MTYDNCFSGGIGLLGAFLSWYIGELSGAIKLLIAMVIIDQISGLLKAGILKKWSSEVGFNGIAKKVFMFLLVGIANIISNEMLGGSLALRDAISLFYVSNEGISIIENAIDSGAPVPEGFKEWFMSWKNRKLVSKNNPADEED